MGSKSWYSLPSSAFACVVEDTDGYLYGWGDDIGDSTTIVRSSPTQITAYPQYSVFKAMAGPVVGVLRTNGTLWLLGAGAQGSLGNNTTAAVSSPVQAFGSYVDFWIPKAGSGNVFAMDASNVLWGWGPNTAGELGVTPLVNSSSPIIISTGISWTQFAGGSNFNLGLRSDGTLWSTGIGTNGVTGQNNVINRSSWTQVGTQSNWTQIAANANNSGGIKADNTLWMWGNGFGGVLGNNTVVSRSSPNQVAGTNWTKVGIGTQHVNALKADGTFWGWGNNTNGQLGRNNVVTTSSPVQTVKSDTSWLDFDTGGTFVMAQRVPPPTASPTPAPTPVPIAGLSCPYGAQTYQNNALTVSNGGDYAVGTGDFTIEWFQKTTSGNPTFGNNLSQYIFSINDNKFAFTEFIPGPYIDPQDIQWNLYVNDTLYTLYTYNFVFEQTSPYGIWLHIALVRASGVVTLYINGVAYGTANVSANMTDTSTLYIGDRTTHDSGAFYNYYGLLTNFRFVNGTAIYTSNFTPPSAPLSDVTNCTLLMQVNSSGAILTDSSSLGKTVTNTLGTVTYTSC
jgi:alpha-tubulin suppressor-like RCC1 family protein